MLTSKKNSGVQNPAIFLSKNREQITNRFRVRRHNNMKKRLDEQKMETLTELIRQV
jgi:L-rhamnose mutarotase